MSAVLPSPSESSPTPVPASADASGSASSAPVDAPPPGAVEPSFVNRLLGVAAAVFAVPVLIELRRLVTGAALGPTLAQEAWLFAAAVVLALAFAEVLRRAPGLRELRAGRVLWVALALEAASLGAALASHAAR